MSNIFYCSWNHPETDETLDDLALHYEYEPGEKESFECPGSLACFWVTKVIHNGKDITDIFSDADLKEMAKHVEENSYDLDADEDDELDERYDNYADQHFDRLFDSR